MLTDNSFEFLICKDYLFVNAYSDFQESVDFCNYNNRELAKIKINSTRVGDDELIKCISKSTEIYYRIGLQFKNNEGTWVGKWSNGDQYEKNKEIRLFSPDHKKDECYDLTIDKLTGRLLKLKCGEPYYFLCKTPEKIKGTKYFKDKAEISTTTNNIDNFYVIASYL